MSSIKNSIRPIRVTNTLTKKKETLVTREPGRLTFYSCGPTVYGLVHLGNLRSALVADLFFRYFERVGYQVSYVRNYTDVDDKIIQKGHEEGISAADVAKKYTDEVEKDFAAVSIREPHHKTKVTEHIAEIIALIGKILDGGAAYVESGEVIFSIDQFKAYGKLSHRNLDDLIAGIRVEVSQKKRNPLDFTLWKPAKPGEPSWESPWGAGRPGWHIECSAMAMKWLGNQIDIHHGGEDLIFPHHENEIAQSEAGSHEAPYVRYWLHHAFLTFSKEKMSKSVGNVFIARDFLREHSPELARALLLSSHYRSIIDFSPDTISQAVSALERLYEAKQEALKISRQSRARPDLRAEGIWGEFVADCEKAKQEIDEQFANDFNTPGAMAALFTLIRQFNKALAEPLARATPSAVLGAQALIEVIEKDIGGILGIGLLEPAQALSDLMRSRPQASGAAGSRPQEAEILALIQDREQARRLKDFQKADEIRKSLESRGVLIKDTPQGTTWKYQ